MSLNVILSAILLIIITVFCPILPQSSWEPLVNPSTKSYTKLHFVDSLNGWVVGDSGTIVQTSDAGENWILQNSGIVGNIVDVFFLNKNVGWALAWKTSPPFGTIILTTDDGGNRWNNEDYPEPNKFMIKILFLDSLHGFMGGSPGEFLNTRDGGLEWNPVHIDSGALANFPVIDFNFFNNKYGFSNGGHIDLSGVIWKTTNYGENWYSTAVGPEPIHALHFFDSLNVIGVGGDFEYGTGVVRSHNGGKRWEYRSLEIFGVAFALSFRTATEGWVPLGTAEKFIVTYDAGETWSEFPTPNQTIIYDVSFTDSLHGFAVGENGAILRYNPNIVGIKQKGYPAVPSTVKLYQNYPNPFNPSTFIAFSIPAQSIVQLTIYDALGQEVDKLINGVLTQGNHFVEFNAKDLPTGLYFYDLQTQSLTNRNEQNILTRKMLLVK